MSIDWDDVDGWGGRVHVGSSDDIGNHGAHCDETDDQ